MLEVAYSKAKTTIGKQEKSGNVPSIMEELEVACSKAKNAIDEQADAQLEVNFF